MILEAKYTHVYAAVDSSAASAFVEARAPIPAIGGIARFYVTRFTPVTVEATGFVLPEDAGRATTAGTSISTRTPR